MSDKLRGQPYPLADRMGRRVCRKVLDRGVWIRPLGDVLVVMPPLAILLDQLDHMLGAIWHGIDAVTRATG